MLWLTLSESSDDGNASDNNNGNKAFQLLQNELMPVCMCVCQLIQQ